MEFKLLVALTLSGAERQHGRLAFACRVSGDHQDLVEAGGLQLREPQGFLAARDANRLPVPHHRPHLVHLTHTDPK